jgi:hypothetical protein
MTTTYLVKEKKDVSGKIVAKVEITRSDVSNIELTRDYIVDRIAELTQELADLQKLLVDVDAKQLSATP